MFPGKTSTLSSGSTFSNHHKEQLVVQCFLKSRYLAVEQCFITKEGYGGLGQPPRMVECAFANGAPRDGGHRGDTGPPVHIH